MNFQKIFYSTSLLVSLFPNTMMGKADKRPNILIILADDLGYSDIGCYGGEIHTPNLDELASEGLRFTHFYNTSRSCPTRASLLTGLYQHQAGIGRMTFNDGLPGYRGTLSRDAVTIAEVLKENGYITSIVGKWHIAETPFREDQTEWLDHHVYHHDFSDLANYPVNRGFDTHYGTIYGVVDYFDPFSLVEGEEPIKEVPKGYYITQALSDRAVAEINKYAKEDKPFFMYLAYNSPHWPLHALPEDIEKYKDTYKVGWEAIRNARYKRQQEMHLFGDAKDFLSDRQFSDKWSDNKDSVWDARAMAVHAAMVDRMDQGIGQVVEALRKNNMFDNTLILFLSDNGCSNENCQNYSPGENDRPDQTRDGRPMIYPHHKEVLPGPETTYASLGPKWANVANTPFRYWKAKSYEGGICTPMIAHWPDVIKSNVGGFNTSIGHVIDIMATCLDIAGAKYPKTYKGHNIIPLEGKSLLPIFETGERAGHQYLGFEHFNERALIDSTDWKIVRPSNSKKWELYNLNIDRSEKHDLAEQYPQKVSQLVSEYNVWAKRCLVNPSPSDKSGNPLFTGRYDYTDAKYLNDTCYIYSVLESSGKPTVDVYSSPDLVNWNLHNDILSSLKVKWLKNNIKSISVLKSADKYYLFFSTFNPKSKKTAIGIAVSSSPVGHYKDALGEPLLEIDSQLPDISVFRDNNRVSYLYFGDENSCKVAMLTDDLLSLRKFRDGTYYKDISLDHYAGCPSLFKHESKYYLIWQAHEDNGNEVLNYAVSDSPIGQFKQQGKLFDSSTRTAVAKGHASIIKVPGRDRYFLVYNRKNDSVTQNSIAVSIDRINFKADRSLIPVKMTDKGVNAIMAETE